MGERETCAHIGCGELFSPADNPDGGCQFHPGQPYFHDGMKEWTCCKKKSHDFGEFMSIPGCTTGRHSSERRSAPSPAVTSKAAEAPAAASTAPASTGCLRCDQGFFCADHLEAPKLVAGGKADKPPARPTEQPPAVLPTASSEPPASKPLPRPTVVRAGPQPDSDGYLTCKHYACGEKYRPEENHEKACRHHPGPAVFHDRKKGWGCCDKHEKDFDSFLGIPPCSYGWHDATFEAGF